MSNGSDVAIKRAAAEIVQEFFLSRLLDPHKMQGLIRDHEAFARKIAGMLKQRAPADTQELLSPAGKKDAYPNVLVTYFYFPLWLAWFDPTLIFPFDVNVRSYRAQR